MQMNNELHTGKPRLGFLGIGWIGQHRMAAIATSGLAEIAAIADPAPDGVARGQSIAPGATVAGSLDQMLELGLDGIVIATPSALHADQAIAALESGCAVFCQKPLGRSAEEVSRIINTARVSNRLLGVDLSYRYTAAMLETR